MGKNIDIDARTYNFALDVLTVVEMIPESRSGIVVARQLARSGTSIGANVEESRAAESSNDFVHKMSIALKEARETHYWLRITRDKKLVPSVEIEPMIRESEEIKNILGASVRTARHRTR
jgi:four helix bundle protein